MEKFYVIMVIAMVCIFAPIFYFGFVLPMQQSSAYWAEIDRYNTALLESGGMTVLTVNMEIPHQIAGTSDIVTFLQWAKNMNETTVYKIGGNNMYYLFQTQHINGEDFKVCYWYQAH